MTIIVGVSPTHRTTDGIALASMLAHSTDTDLLLVAVVPAPWKGKNAHLDKGYRDDLRLRAGHALAEAEQSIPADVTFTTQIRESASISEGLVAAAFDAESAMLVLGSSTMGLLGRVALGSVTERLLHSSPVAVAVSPRGFSAAADQRVSRVSIAYAVGPDESSLIATAAEVGGQIGAGVRLVSFAARPAAPVTSGVGFRAEDDVLDQWALDVTATTDELNRQVSAAAGDCAVEPAVIGRGETWSRALEAVDWSPGEVLVIGSSRTARAAGVFLGGTASKIARHSPVPVIVLPRPSD